MIWAVAFNANEQWHLPVWEPTPGTILTVWKRENCINITEKEKKIPQQTTKNQLKKPECFLKGRSIFGFADKPRCHSQQARWLKLEQNWSFFYEGFKDLKIWLCFKFQVTLCDLKPPWKWHISLIWSNTSFGQNSRFQAQLWHTGIQEEKL